MTIEKDIERLQQSLRPEHLAKMAYPFFREVTPKNTGNARAKTKLSGASILAQYPYAGRLDTGWSDQAPDGMVKPTVEYLKGEIDKLIK